MTLLMAWGSCEHGQFAATETGLLEHRYPQNLEWFAAKDLKIVQIACGARHCLVLTDKGEVYSFGDNTDYALGRMGDPSIPSKIHLANPVDAISCGDTHSVCASNIGDSTELLVWGTFGSPHPDLRTSSGVERPKEVWI